MTKKSFTLIFALSALGFSMLACSLVGKSDQTPASKPELNANSSASDNKNENANMDYSENSNANEDNSNDSDSNTSKQESEFPLPGNVKIILANPDLVTGTVKITMDDIVAFYRKELTKQGLTEDTLLTTISDTTYSLVFKGSSNGKSVVVQGTELGDGTIAFSVRYE
jgi:hypothetical protein